jgi:hypothetical protein
VPVKLLEKRETVGEQGGEQQVRALPRRASLRLDEVLQARPWREAAGAGEDMLGIGQPHRRGDLGMMHKNQGVGARIAAAAGLLQRLGLLVQSEMDRELPRPVFVSITRPSAPRAFHSSITHAAAAVSCPTWPRWSALLDERHVCLLA